jgi:transcriptional regulator with XRE-family HTH domain
MAMRSVLGFNGTKLLALRTKGGLTQQELSDKTARRRRIHRDTVSRYENGETSPSPLNFGILVWALDCEPADLLDEAEAGAA